MLSGGNVNRVVRAGNTVRRPTGPWTPAVHGLLGYLDASGFRAAPRVLGIDRLGRETLEFIEGCTLGPGGTWPDWIWHEDVVRAAMTLLRAYHAKAAGYRPHQELEWQFSRARLLPDEIVCHNDFAPHNVVYRERRPVAIIDWDAAGPGRPAWDLAWAAWSWVPLASPVNLPRAVQPGDQARRLRIVCDAYGLADRTKFVDQIVERAETTARWILEKAAGGDASFQRLAAGHLGYLHLNLEHLRARRDELEDTLLG